MHQWCFAVCPVAAHVDRLKSSLEVQKQRWFHMGFKPLLLKGFQGLSHTVLQTSQFHSTDSSRNSQRHTLLALHSLASCWKAAGMCSFSLYLLKWSPTLYPRYCPMFYFSSHATLSSLCCHFLSVQKPFVKSHSLVTDRIPNWDLALPYREARTSLT